MKDKTRIIETLVGIAIISIFIICLVIIYRSANPRIDTSRNYYNLRAIFDRADGITLGSDVMISGVRVGSVSAMELDENNYTAVITLTLANKFKIPVDSSAEIVSSSLLGDKYINLVIGSESEFLKKDEAFEFTQSSISIEQLLSKMLFGLDGGAANKEENKEETGSLDEIGLTISENENETKAGPNQTNSGHSPANPSAHTIGKFTQNPGLMPEEPLENASSPINGTNFDKNTNDRINSGDLSKNSSINTPETTKSGDSTQHNKASSEKAASPAGKPTTPLKLGQNSTNTSNTATQQIASENERNGQNKPENTGMSEPNSLQDELNLT